MHGATRFKVIGIGLLAVLWSSTCLAVEKRFQDWSFSSDRQYQEASTTSDSGALLGVYCTLSSEQCFAYFTTGQRCAQDQSVPVLVNADTGAVTLETTCRSIEGNQGKIWVNVFNDYSTATEIMLKAGKFGIAVPLASGAFKALRFSLMGSNDAIAGAVRKPAVHARNVKDETF